MTEYSQAEVLLKRHADLDRQLEGEQKRPQPNTEVIAELKRQKLALKDQIQDAEAGVPA